MTNKLNREEMKKELEKAEKRMKERGHCYDGLGESIDKLDEINGEENNGVILAPKTEMDFQRIRKKIRDSVIGEDKESEN